MDREMLLSKESKASALAMKEFCFAREGGSSFWNSSESEIFADKREWDLVNRVLKSMGMDS